MQWECSFPELGIREVRAFPILDDLGRVELVAGQMIDISHRNEYRHRLQESETRYRELTDCLPQTIFETDHAGLLTFASRHALEEFGYCPEDIERGLPLLDTIAPQDRPRAAQRFQQHLLGMSMGGEEYLALRENGSTFPALIFATPVHRNSAIVGIRGVLINITAQKDLEAQLIQAQRMEAVAQLARGVAHDFKNLLTIINGYSDLLLKTIRHEPQRGYLESVKAAGEKADSLVTQLFALSRSQQGRSKPTDLNALLAGLNDLLQRLLGAGIVMKHNLAPRLARVMADPFLLEQVVMNIAVNARDAMAGKGCLSVETRNVLLDDRNDPAWPSASEPAPYIMLAISDTGCGMKRETVARIFEPFFTTKPDNQGTGLGLSIVDNVIRQAGGHVHVFSRLGEGSTFSIYLPQHTPETEEPP